MCLFIIVVMWTPVYVFIYYCSDVDTSLYVFIYYCSDEDTTLCVYLSL